MRIVLGEQTLHPQSSLVNPEFNFVALDHPVYVLDGGNMRQIGVYSLHVRGERVITQVFKYSHDGIPVTLVKNSKGGREDRYSVEFPDFLGTLYRAQEKPQERPAELQNTEDRPINPNAYNRHPPVRKPFEPTERIHLNYPINSSPRKSFNKRLQM